MKLKPSMAISYSANSVQSRVMSDSWYQTEYAISNRLKNHIRDAVAMQVARHLRLTERTRDALSDYSGVGV